MIRNRLFPLFCFPAFALLLAGLLTGCAERTTGVADTPAPLETWFPLSIDGTALEVQVALGPQEQQHGLMHRDALGENRGMVFLFTSPGPRAFWMKNTRIPLDIGYFDAAGTLLEIHALYPYDETAVPSASSAVQIAVETNQGWFRAKGLRPGARLDLAALAAAVTARGGDIATYRLNTGQP